MADSYCIVEMKETIENMNAELGQPHTKISELDAKVRGQEKCLLAAQKEMAKLQEENARLARDLKEENTRLARDLKEENAQLARDLKEENALLARDLKEENAQLARDLKEENARLVIDLKEENARLASDLKEENARLVKDLKEENAQLAKDLKESEEKCRTVQEKWELAEQKLAQFLQKPIAAAEESLAQVSIGSVGTMADSCCIAELKETIDEMNAELIQSHNKISELNAKVREQEECLSAARKEMRKRREENARLARDLKEVNETNDDALDINSLPNEIILKIFSYLTQNQLGQFARVCRRWNVLTKSPVLWRKVNVKIFSSATEKNAVVKSFINGLPSCVTFIRLGFSKYDDLDFEELCVKLHQNCPHLEELILEPKSITSARCGISNILPEVINCCTQFLQCVKRLVFHYCRFSNHSRTVELDENSKIEVLDLCCCDVEHFNRTQFSKLLHLKELRLNFTNVDDTWFVDDTSFFNQLQVLVLGMTRITASTFVAIQNHSHNLKELYLCNLNLQAHDLNFNKSVFPQLRTICLSENCVTRRGVVSLIQSCPSLENVYVNREVAESFASHPFVVVNRCKSGIVKAIDYYHNHNVDY